VLEYLNKALGVISRDIPEQRRKDELLHKAFAQARSGEITKEAYMDLSAILNWKSVEGHKKEIRAEEEILLFTETFYHFAWRLVEVLRSTSSKSSFEGFIKLKAEGIQTVRNHLVQHPERQKTKIFRPAFSISSNGAGAGPVLKSLGPVVQLLPDKVEAVYDGPDRGLFVNAQELHDEILEILRTKLG
jgi:hypothetical protein